ncbi:MAG TPA: hypothetical protein PKH03_11120 [Syntrophales bacterium]|nr:hypothetical protein [Syntrophales bacterium]
MVFHIITLTKRRPITIMGAEFRFLASRKAFFFGTNTGVRQDPLLPAEGKFLHRWRLQLNVTPEELRHRGEDKDVW